MLITLGVAVGALRRSAGRRAPALAARALATGGDLSGRRPRTAADVHGHIGLHRAGARVQVARHRRCSCSSSWRRRARRSGRSRVYGAAIVALALARTCRSPTLGRRLVIELPFLAFAFFLPFIGRGERVEVLGLSLSVAGLWGAWNILVKGTLGVAASVVLAATTDTRDLLRGLERLHLPKVLVAIASFMLRYLDVIAGEMRRDADRPAVAGLRPALDLAGARRGRVGRHAVHPLLRAGRARVPRDGRRAATPARCR